MAAVYAVPDPHGGDQVMAALELRDGSAFDADGFGTFLESQSDLGTKWAPRFVRVVDQMPLTGTNKVLKAPLQHSGWHTTDPVWWRPGRDLAYVALRDDVRAELDSALEVHARSYHRNP